MLSSTSQSPEHLGVSLGDPCTLECGPGAPALWTDLRSLVPHKLSFTPSSDPCVYHWPSWSRIICGTLRLPEHPHTRQINWRSTLVLLTPVSLNILLMGVLRSSGRNWEISSPPSCLLLSFCSQLCAPVSEWRPVSAAPALRVQTGHPG